MTDAELVANIKDGTLDTRLVLVHRGDLTTGIRPGGTFSGFLFFGDDSHYGEHRYFFARGTVAVTEPARWAYDAEMQDAIAERVGEVAELLGCDEDAAYDAICDGDYDTSALADAWAVQRITCEIARSVGYAIVELRDEHGTSYAVDALDADVTIYDERGEPVPVCR
jgi:hypothetical protein